MTANLTADNNHEKTQKINRLFGMCRGLSVLGLSTFIISLTLPAMAGVRSYNVRNSTTDSETIAVARLECGSGFIRPRFAKTQINLVLGALLGEEPNGGLATIGIIKTDGGDTRVAGLIPSGEAALRGITRVPTNSQQVLLKGEFTTRRVIPNTNPQATEIYEYRIVGTNPNAFLLPSVQCPPVD